MSQIEISNVVNISVSQAGAGAGDYNTSNLAIFSDEAYEVSFGEAGYKLYLGPTGVGEDFGTDSKTYKMALAVFSQQPNILAGGGYLAVVPYIDIYGSETLTEAIARTKDMVQYFGLMTTGILAEAAMLDAAAAVQALNKIAFFVSDDDVDMDDGGMLDDLRSGGFTKSRGLYYGVGAVVDALVFMAAYASRGLSTNFSGSNTTQDMHMKSLNGVLPDTTITQTFLNKAKLAGVDLYPSVQGVPKVYCSGANKFFDQVYNLEWFVGALQIAGFNVLAQSSTKVPQTEQGIGSLKGAYRRVSEQAVANQFLAPGSWTSPDSFGVQEDFLENIAQRGYYIYSQPIGLQSPTDRADRKAPLIQIAAKEAGAVNSSTVIINVNA